MDDAVNLQASVHFAVKTESSVPSALSSLWNDDLCILYFII